MNAVMYVDGSCFKGKPTEKFVNGYGVVLLVDDKHYELSEGALVTQNQVNQHEEYSFLFGLNLAASLGVDLTKLTVFCDDQSLGAANTWLHPGNYSSKGDLVRKQVQTLRRATDEQRSRMLWFLEHGLVHKLKGHSLDVYQERVDYLAKHAAYRAMGKDEPLKPYDEWLSSGFRVFDCTVNRYVTYYPPFVESANANNQTQ